MGTTTLTPLSHKQQLQAAFEAMAIGDTRPFGALFAEDFTWTIPGDSAWGRTWSGRTNVHEQLLRPLFERFADTYTSRAIRFVAEGDVVVVECRGRVMARSGHRYDNTYCYVCEFGADGLMHKLTEYMDTALAAKALGPAP
jgi:uncharacterized protein